MNKELIKNFDYIKHNILHKYKRAQAYARMKSMPRTAQGNAELAAVLEPLVDLIDSIDLSKEDNKEHLKQFSAEWDKVRGGLPGIYEKLSMVDGAYDDIWEDMQKLEDSTNEFLQQVEVESQNNEPEAEVIQQPVLEPQVTEEIKQKVATPPQQKPEQRSELIQKIFSTPVRDLPHQEKQNTNNVLGELEKILAKTNPQHAPESFKEMMFDLKKLADEKQVSEDMIGEYRTIITNARNGFSRERSLMDLYAVLSNQIDGIKTKEAAKPSIAKDVVKTMQQHVFDSREVTPLEHIDKQKNFRDATQKVLDIAEKNKRAKEQTLIKHLINNRINE